MMKFITFAFVALLRFSYYCNGLDLRDSQLTKNCGNSDPGLIHGGYKSELKETPWKVAIFRKEDNNETEYICGGSLISNDLIVTAAHCVHEKREEYPTETNKLWILLGSNDISKSSEFGRQNVSVEEIIIHENWNPKLTRYNDDIALIRLSSPVTFDAFIQPICLMTHDQTLSNGKVAGWGSVDDSGTTAKTAKIAELTIIALSECLLRNFLLAIIAWKDSFCAQSEINGVCSGDSGSGFYVDIQNKRYLKGLVSSAIQRDCSENSIAIYTDISKYIGFITENFNYQSNVLEFKCYTKSDADASYVIQDFFPHNFTVCDANFENFNFNSRVTEIKTNIPISQYDQVERISLFGMRKFLIIKNDILKRTFPKLKQLFLKLNNDIELTRQLSNFIKHFQSIEYLNIGGIKIDQNLENIFGNLKNLKFLVLRNSNFSNGLPTDIFLPLKKLKYLSVWKCGLLKALNEKIFDSNVDLEYLFFKDNKIEFLPENVFDSLTKLNHLDFGSNKIKELPSKIFSKLTNLRILSFYMNKITSLHLELFRKNTKLEELWFFRNQIQNLSENVFQSLTLLKGLRLVDNKIKKLPPKIFSELRNLEALQLSKSRIKVLPENIFGSLTNLKKLYLEQNEIEVLPETLLKNNINLEIFIVRENKLKEIYVDFGALPKLKQLAIGSANECIDIDHLESTSKIQGIVQEILEKCKNN